MYASMGYLDFGQEGQRDSEYRRLNLGSRRDILAQMQIRGGRDLFGLD
jgi:hypothetical protein